MRPRHEVADVLHLLGNTIETIGLNTHQLRTLRAMKSCRSPALGGHVDACDQCGVIRISYNSCRNRHCPKCQGHKRVAWIEGRSKDLLPCTYYHVVFTLPQQLNRLAMHQPKIVYDALFKAAWQTLHQFGNTAGIQLGMIAVLHTCLSRAKLTGGSKFKPSPTPALHCTGWWSRWDRSMA